MRHAAVILAVLVSAAALGLSVFAERMRAEDGAAGGVDLRIDVLRSRLNGLEKQLAETDGVVGSLTDRINKLDETSKGLIGMKVPTEAELRKTVDGVLEEKLKKVKWTPKTKAKFEPKSAKDKTFARMHQAVRGAARLGEDDSNALLALMLEQRGKLNDVYSDAKKKKQDAKTRDRRLGDVKRRFDAVLKWKLTTDQYNRYVGWRDKVRDRYIRAFLVP